MRVAYDRESLDKSLQLAVDISTDHPVVLTEFLVGAREIELDGVAKDGEILTAVVSEHVENAGVHSGDATMVVPAQKLYVETVRRVLQECGGNISVAARRLGVSRNTIYRKLYWPPGAGR